MLHVEGTDDIRLEGSQSQVGRADSDLSTGVIEAQIIMVQAESEALNAQREAELKANKLRQSQLQVQLAEARFNADRSRSLRRAHRSEEFDISRALSDIVGGYDPFRPDVCRPGQRPEAQCAARQHPPA